MGLFRLLVKAANSYFGRRSNILNIGAYSLHKICVSGLSTLNEFLEALDSRRGEVYNWINIGVYTHN